MSRLVRTAKESARHLMHSLGWRRKYPHLQFVHMRDRFSAIYDTGVWQNGMVDQPLSGQGSSLEVTEALRANLRATLDRLGSRTLLDIGCGDLTWMKQIQLHQSYVGIDIVPSVVEANRAKLPAADFHCLDATTDDLPEGDTILCREVLFHLSFADGQKLIANVCRKPRKWLICTTDSQTMINADIESGDFRMLNLRKAPYRFGEPVAVIADDGLIEGRELGVWDISAGAPILAG
jgi:SAM-dependent methyltransferase